MAVLIMSSSKNSSYADAQRYLQYKHREDKTHGGYTPILDEFGFLQERDNYGLCFVDGHGQLRDSEEWMTSCIDTNLAFGKNQNKKDRKQFIFVISHPEADTPFMTKEALLEEGMAFVRDNLKGYDALIAAHTDTDNRHVHIAINSVRAVERPEEPWMMRNEDGQILRCEVKAGGKHQNSPLFRRHCQEWLLNYTRTHGLTLEDNNQIEDQRKQQRSQKTEELKRTILDVASHSTSVADFQRKLKAEKGISLIRRGETYTLHLPDAHKGKRLQSIGLFMDEIIGSLRIPETTKEQLRDEEHFHVEKRKYLHWIKERRLKNCRRAEDTIAEAASLLAAKLPGWHNRENFQELRDLLRQTTYLERDLQTEQDKLDRLLDRWNRYRNETASEAKHSSHGSYVRWCGCDPDSDTEYQELALSRESISIQIQHAAALREALVDASVQWQQDNAEARFRYHQEWTINHADYLKHKLEDIRTNRKKLEQIAFNCQKASFRRGFDREYQQKADYFYSLLSQKAAEEKALKKELRHVKREIRRDRSH